MLAFVGKAKDIVKTVKGNEESFVTTTVTPDSGRQCGRKREYNCLTA